jgi:hypothetical protein
MSDPSRGKTLVIEGQECVLSHESFGYKDRYPSHQRPVDDAGPPLRYRRDGRQDRRHGFEGPQTGGEALNATPAKECRDGPGGAVRYLVKGILKGEKHVSQICETSEKGPQCLSVHDDPRRPRGGLFRDLYFLRIRGWTEMGRLILSVRWNIATLGVALFLAAANRPGRRSPLQLIMHQD